MTLAIKTSKYRISNLVAKLLVVQARPYLYEILWGERLKYGHKEVDHVFISSVLALEQEVLVM